MRLDRRTALIGLTSMGATASVLLGPALAQSKPAPSAAGAEEYVEQTLLLGKLSIRMSELAVARASHPNVQQFARLEITEQQAIASVLAASSPSDPSSMVKAEQQAVLNRLEGAEAGTAFDRAYLQAQIDGHNELVAVQQRLSAQQQATVEAITARLVEQAVTSHLVMLDLIMQQLDEGAEDGESPDGSGGDAQVAPPVGS